jgi:hypothetical protein
VQPGAARALLDDVERRGLTLDWLVNNAGFGTMGRFAELRIERELEEIRLNIEALVELTGRSLPGMVARNRGVVMNVASVAAFTPSAYMATYSATKAFVLSFTEALSVELAGSGVQVLCVCPGFTKTEFQEKAEVDQARVPQFAWMSAEQVADQAVDAVGKKTILVNGTMNSLLTSGVKFVPRGVLARIVGSLMRPPQEAR